MVGSYAVKNHMGLLSGEERLEMHSSGVAEGIWYLQSCLAKAVPNEIHIIDGLVSFQGYHASPSYVEPGVFIAGLNPCAVDFVCSRTMGMDPKTQFPQYRVALDNDFAYGLIKPLKLVGAAIDSIEFQCHIPAQILKPPSFLSSIRIHWGEFGYPINQSLKDLFRAMDFDLPLDVYVGGAAPMESNTDRLCLCIGNASVASNVRKDPWIFELPGDPPAGTVFHTVIQKMISYWQAKLQK
jgi:hypothetical protein